MVFNLCADTLVLHLPSGSLQSLSVFLSVSNYFSSLSTTFCLRSMMKCSRIIFFSFLKYTSISITSIDIVLIWVLLSQVLLLILWNPHKNFSSLWRWKCCCIYALSWNKHHILVISVVCVSFVQLTGWMKCSFSSLNLVDDVAMTVLLSCFVGSASAIFWHTGLQVQKDWTQETIDEGIKLPLVFLGYAGFGIVLVFMSSCLVLLWAPAAAGGGVSWTKFCNCEVYSIA